MEPTMSLTDYYDKIKSDAVEPTPPAPAMYNVQPSPVGMNHAAGALQWRNKAAKCAEDLRDKCCKHLIVDIYCKIHPLDKEYVYGHHGMMCKDVDCMLDKKGMNATQYITSCYESTKAPMLEFLLRSTSNIARSYMEAADETLKDAQKKDIPLQEPVTPSTDDEDINNQLVDIKKDTEYEGFIEKLKQKTINRIVSDVSKIISDKKEEKNMTFDTDGVGQESTVTVGLEYFQKKLWNENANLTKEQMDQMLGIAIREATLHQLDVVFNQPAGQFKVYESAIRFGKGIIVNEAAVNEIKSMQ